jgi:hypothetical protein
MAKYLSKRQPNLNLGISSYTESNTVLQTIGKVGIGTTNAGSYSLYVVGTTNITGDINVGGASTFVGVGTFGNDLYVANQLYVGGVNVSGGSSIGEDITTRNFLATGISTFNGFVDANGGLDVTGHTELDNVNVSGVATIASLAVQSNFNVYDTQAVFHNDLFIAGNLSIGGTTTVLIAEDLFIIDKTIVLGIATDSLNVDIANDDSANGGGISVASTQGSPLVSLQAVGVNSLPNTHKKILWSKANTYGIGTTDAWMFNYAVGIGSTLVPNGVRFAVSEIQFTDDTINTPNINVAQNLNISGTSTLGIASASQLYVSGLSTFAGITTVTGSTLFAKQLNISGISTFVGITTNQSTIFGTQLSVSGVSTFFGTIDANGDLDVDGHTELDNVNISGITTFAGAIDADGDLDVDGHTELDNVNISGITTFAGAIDADGDLDVDGHTELDNVNISGITTFAGAIDANGDLDVDGHTELDNVNISGITTFAGAIDANGDLDVDGHTELDNVNIIGITTFAGAIDANGDLDVDGHTELDNVNVSGIITATAFHTGAEGSAIRITSNTISGPANLIIDPAAVGDDTGAVRIKGDLFVDGTQFVVNSTTIELADFNVGIATTVGTNLILDGAGIGIGSANIRKTFVYDDASNTLQSSIGLGVTVGGDFKTGTDSVLNRTTLGPTVVNSSLTSVGTLFSLNVSGLSTFAGITTVTGSTLFAKQLNVSGVSTLAVLHTPSLTNDGSDFGSSGYFPKANGSGGWSWTAVPGLFSVNNILNGFTVTEEGSIVGTAGSITQLDFRGNNIIVTADSAPNGIATVRVSDTPSFTTLNVTGLSTFAGITTVTGSTLFTNQLSVSGFSTFVGVGTFQSDLYVGGNLFVQNDLVFDEFTARNINVTGIGTIAASSLGFANASTLNVTGLSTFAGITTVTGSTLFTNQLSVSGISTFTGAIDANGDLDVDGHTELDNVNISGITTFVGAIDANGDLDVDGHTELDNVNISGITTFVGAIDANGDLDVDGHTELDNVNISGITTFVGAIDANGDLDVDGYTELDDVNISGITTFVGAIDANGDLDVDGYTELDDVNISGTLNVVGLSTFAGITTVTGPTLFTNQLSVLGVSTFNGIVQVGAAITLYPATGIISATSFYGDGASLTNTGSTLSAASGTQRVVLTSLTSGTMVTSSTDGDLTFDAATNTLSVIAISASNATFSGNVSIAGTLTYEDVTNIDSIGVVTARSSVVVGAGLSVVGFTTLASAGGITTTGGDLYVGDDLFFKGNLYKNNQLFTSGVGIGSTTVNPGSGLINAINNRIGVGFTDINFVGTGISVTGYGSTVVIDFGNIAAASGGALSISTIFSPRIQDISFVGGASTSIIGISTQTDRFIFDTQTGSVGIGTTGSSIPSYKLDVIGDINSSTSVKIKGVDVLEEAVRLAIAFG